jgi:hypothetical protein
MRAAPRMDPCPPGKQVCGRGRGRATRVGRARRGLRWRGAQARTHPLQHGAQHHAVGRCGRGSVAGRVSKSGGHSASRRGATRRDAGIKVKEPPANHAAAARLNRRRPTRDGGAATTRRRRRAWAAAARARRAARRDRKPGSWAGCTLPRPRPCPRSRQAAVTARPPRRRTGGARATRRRPAQRHHHAAGCAAAAERRAARAAPRAAPAAARAQARPQSCL